MAEYFLSAIRKGNAYIVVLDDLDGLGIGDATELNSFLYQMRNAAIQSGTIVFILLDLSEIPKRTDKRPVITDSVINKLSKFCDFIQFLYCNDDDDVVSSETRILELIVEKNYSTTQNGVFSWAQFPAYSAMTEFKHEIEQRKDIFEKYPGILLGVQVLAECLENYNPYS